MNITKELFRSAYFIEYIPRRLFKQSYTCFIVFLKVNLCSEIIFSLSIFLKCIALQLISASELITLLGTLDCRFNCKFAKVPRCKVLTTVSWPCFNYCKWQRLNSWNMCSRFPHLHSYSVGFLRIHSPFCWWEERCEISHGLYLYMRWLCMLWQGGDSVPQNLHLNLVNVWWTELGHYMKKKITSSSP